MTAINKTKTDSKLLLDDGSFHLSNYSFGLISRQQLELIKKLTGRNISGLGQDAMCSSAAYCELSKENSDVFLTNAFSVWLIVFSALLK